MAKYRSWTEPYEEEYRGWTNYETFVIAEHLDGFCGTHELVETAMAQAMPTKEMQVGSVESAIRRYVSARVNRDRVEGSFTSDLLFAVEDRVDSKQIAQRLVERTSRRPIHRTAIRR